MKKTSKVTRSEEKSETLSKEEFRPEDSKILPPRSHDNSRIMYSLLREQLMAKLALVIKDKNWTQVETGRILRVPQSRISDLMRAKTSKFAIDKLIYWLCVLGQEITIDIQSVPGDMAPQPKSAANDTIAYLTNVLSLEPQNEIAFQNRADAHMVLKNFELAIDDYTRCIEIRPDARGARIQRVQAFRASKRLPEALKDCNDLVMLFGDGYGLRGSIYDDLGNYEQALVDYNKSVQKEPNSAGAIWNRGSLHERLGNYENALADYTLAFKLNTNLSFVSKSIEQLQQKIALKKFDN